MMGTGGTYKEGQTILQRHHREIYASLLVRPAISIIYITEMS